MVELAQDLYHDAEFVSTPSGQELTGSLEVGRNQDLHIASDLVVLKSKWVACPSYICLFDAAISLSSQSGTGVLLKI